MAGVVNVEQLRSDLDEVKRLLPLAARQRIQGVLSIEKGRLEAEIALREKDVPVGEGGDVTGTTPAGQKPAILSLVTTAIKTYGWDQSDKFVKLYVTINGVGAVPAANVSVEYGEQSFKLLVQGLRDSNHQLAINGLLKAIIPSESHFKIKPDSVVILLKKKEQASRWSYLTKVEQRLKDKGDGAPKMDGGAPADPNAGMMDMMKKMYDEGDDEMKRSIAKAWTESKDKQGGAGAGAGFGM